MVYIKNQLHSVKRVDIVWDQYFPDSLKKKKRETIMADVYTGRLNQMVICHMTGLPFLHTVNCLNVLLRN